MGNIANLYHSLSHKKGCCVTCISNVSLGTARACPRMHAGCSCAAYKSGCTGNAARMRTAGMLVSRPSISAVALARTTALVVAALLLLVPRLADGKLCPLPDPSSEHLAILQDKAS